MPCKEIISPERRREAYNTLSIVSQGQTHPTYLAHKIPPGWYNNPQGSLLEPKHRAAWFIKATSNPQRAQRERLAQELFRLLAIGQPKTRIAKETFVDRFRHLCERYWVASKGVRGFLPFKTYNLTHNNSYQSLIAKLLSGEVYGLGQVLVTALWVNEIDGHENNYGLDEAGRVVKIDGDYCFARLIPEMAPVLGKALITTRDLKTLPFIQDYVTNNWLDIIFHHQWVPGMELSSQALQHSPKIRQEVLEGILHIISLPDDFLDHMTRAYIDNPQEIQLLSQELKDRRKMLTDAAFGMPEFVAYVKSSAAEQCIQRQQEALKNFRVRSTLHLWHPAFQTSFDAAFAALRQRPAGPGVAVYMNRPQPSAAPIVQPPPPVQYFGQRPVRAHSVVQPAPVAQPQPARRYSVMPQGGFIQARY